MLGGPRELVDSDLEEFVQTIGIKLVSLPRPTIRPTVAS